LVLIAVLLAVIPAVAVLYPFIRRSTAPSTRDDESSTSAELSRMWETALGGLRDAELERAVGRLSEDDYRWLRERYMTDAALAMKAMDLEEQEEQALHASIRLEVQRVRQRVLGSEAGQEATGE
jgi:hypothetical protein